jgi:S-adenosylmethionine decarboxylase
MHALGQHLLLDLWGVGPLLDDIEGLRQALEEAAKAGGATVVESRFHQFSPQGVSGVVILAESHLALHTWPENDFAAVDVFTCGDPQLTRSVADQVVARLTPLVHQMRSFERGTPLAVTAENR